MTTIAIGANRAAVYTANYSKSSVSASNTTAAAAPPPGQTEVKSDVYQKLDDYVKMTPAQRMREELLKKLGLTEDELASKSPQEREGIETKLRDLVKQQMQDAQAKHLTTMQPVGQLIDTTA